MESNLTTCLVASGGGHLEQGRRLLARLSGARPALVVTYRAADVPDGQIIAAHYPTTKNLPNAVRNYRLARRVFAEHEVTRVVSTGAAVAVPFMIRARQLGIPCHYIESATRVEGPSLSGRILQRVPGLCLYRQTGEWGSPRWQQGPCVFDGYRVDTAGAGAVERVVVSLGTHSFPFDAAVARLRDVLRDAGCEVLWQLGSTRDPGDLPGRVVTQLPAGELQTALENADVVVGHAGVGLSLTALTAGKVPVLLPRRRRRREHTDDHQVQLARELDRRGLAISAAVGDLTHDHLVRAASLQVGFTPPEPFRLVD